VQDVKVDLKDDRFDVTYSPAKVNLEQLLETIRELGYEPRVVETKVGVDEDTAERVDLSALPRSLADVFVQARKAGKPVLVHFTGPG
jgi:hypothetical protein